MLTRPHAPTLGHHDPRLDRRTPHTFRPTRPVPACSCGCAGPHEVARRTTLDDARLVLLSTGEMRLFLRHGIAPTMIVHVDRFAAPARHLLGWASVMTASEVERAMVAAHES